MEDWIKIAAVICTCIVLLYLWSIRSESFTNKKEKVNAIHSWWQNEKNPSYELYIKDIPGSDVVEYKRVKDIVLGGNSPTPANIEKLVN